MGNSILFYSSLVASWSLGLFIFLLILKHLCVLSCSAVSDSLQFPWTVYHQAPLSMGFSRQEYWSGLPFPPPGDLPDPVIQLRSLVSPALQADSLPAEPLRKSMLSIDSRIIYIFQLQALWQIQELKYLLPLLDLFLYSLKHDFWWRDVVNFNTAQYITFKL